MSDSLIEWLDRGLEGDDSVQITKRLMMADGTSMSIQAGRTHYCEPRRKSPTNSYSYYQSFEIGFPSREIDGLMGYAEEPERPTQTVYGYVPKSVIDSVIESCGGIAGFDQQFHQSAPRGAGAQDMTYSDIALNNRTKRESSAIVETHYKLMADIKDLECQYIEAFSSGDTKRCQEIKREIDQQHTRGE